MALSWSHTVLQVKNAQTMLDFYTGMLGFQMTDEGPISDGRHIYFLSQQADEHHQLGLVSTRTDDGPPNSLAHVAFRVESMGELRRVIARLEAANIGYRPTSHGTTWSVYFQDPEQNGIEIFYDTPFHVQQPQGQLWDVTLPDAELMAWTEATFKDEAEFSPRAAYVARREQELGEKALAGD